MICKNCGHNLEGNFCENCGQKSIINRIDFKFLMHEIPNSIFQLNRGLLYTIKEMYIRPGQTIRDFINGKRKPFYNPISFFIVLSAIYVLGAHLLGKNTFVAELVTGVMDGIGLSKTSSGLELSNWILSNQTYVALLFIPIFALASYIAFIKSEYNYFEHLIINLFVTGQQMIIYLFFIFITSEDSISTALPILISIAYNIWTYFQFFDKKKKLEKTLLIILTYMFVILIAFIILFTVVFVTEAKR